MAENKIYALICGLGHIEFSKNVDAEFTSPDGLIEVNPNDYNLIFIKDLSKVSTGSLYLLFEKISKAKLLLFLPSQFYLSPILHTNPFIMNSNKGNHVIISGDTWLAKELRNLQSEINLSYDAEFEPSQNTASIIAMTQTLRFLQKDQPKKIQEKYSVVATNPAGKTISFILREYGNSTLIVFPYISGPDDKVQSLVKRIIERAITTEIGVSIGKEVPEWIQNAFPDRRRMLNDLVNKYQVVSSFIKMAQGLYYQSGEELETTVGKVLEYMGLRVEFVGREREQRDLIIEFSNGKKIITEVKGLSGQADFRHISNFLAGNPSAKELCFVVNNDLDVSIPEREDISLYPPFHPLAVKKIKEHIENGKIKEFYPLSTIELAKWASEGVKDLDLLKRMEEYKDKIMGKRTQVTVNPFSKPISVSHLPKYAKEEKNEGS